jgi:transposase
MKRYCVDDKAWAKIEPLLPTRGGKPDNRLFFNAVYYIAKSGAPWRDLPTAYGKWNSVFQRFNRWSKSGVWEKVFKAFSDADLRFLAIDSTIIRANQQAAGALKKIKRPRRSDVPAAG